MHIIQEKIGKPKIEKVSGDADINAIYSIHPLPAGYGVTLGNSLRRVLLSSLPGIAITGLKIKGASHEYSTLEGIKDGVLDIILNLKSINFKKSGSEKEVIKLKKKGLGPITAGDIESSSSVEVLNKDFVITEITGKTTEFEMDLIIEKGVGYLPAKEKVEDEDLAEFIFIDANFSPVKKVEYSIVSDRVGDMINLDNLQMSIETDGSISILDSLKFASNVLNSYYGLVIEDAEPVEPEFVGDFSRTGMMEENVEEEKESYTPIEILNFSPRTLNSLLNAEIGSVELLLKCSRAKLGTFKGFGKKAMDEVGDALGERDLKLLGD